MRIKPRIGIYTWSPVIRPPLIPPINMIFERSDNNDRIFTNAALLYQDILKYGIEHNDGFGFTELGNWLINNNYEFRTYYTGDKARTPKSARLANRRQTIQEGIDNLMKMDLLYEKSKIKSQKNLSDIPLYSLTTEGQFLAWIIEGKDPYKSFDLNWVLKDLGNTKPNKVSRTNEKSSNTIMRIFQIVDSFTKIKDSYTLLFLSKLFRKCMDTGIFGNIVDYFYYSDLQHVEVNKGHELLRLFVKIAHPLNWIYAYPEIFAKTFDEMDEETKKVMLSQFKMEIEEYYSKYYLVSYARRITYAKYHDVSTRYSNDMAISGREWQLMRCNNMVNYKNVVIPGFCYNCNLECPFILDIDDYLAYLGAFASGKIRPLSDVIRSDCIKCGRKDSVVGQLYMALNKVKGQELSAVLDMISEHEII
jgi:hypothetical protein